MKPITKVVRAERRKEAEARQASRNERTPEQQLAKLDAGGFIATAERARLNALRWRKPEPTEPKAPKPERKHRRQKRARS